MPSSKHATRAPANRAVKTTTKAAKVDAREEQPIPLAPTEKPLRVLNWSDARHLAEDTLARLSGRKQAVNSLEGMLYVAADELAVLRLAVLRTVQPHELELIANTAWNLQQRIMLAIELQQALTGAEVD